jgi:hypothetical protein
MAEGFPTEVNQSVQFLDPFTKEQTISLMEQARGVSAKPVPIPTQGVAGFTPDQEAAFASARQGIGAYKPFLDQASSLYGDAQSQYVGQGQTIGEGLDLTRRSIDPTGDALGIVAGMKTGSQDYQSPYTQGVIDESLKEINRQSDIEQQGIAAAGVRAGAFGGSRYGILEAEHLRNTADKRNQIIANLRERGYTQAQDTALKAAELTSNLGSQYGKIGGQVASIGGGYGNVAQGQANIGQGLSSLGQLGTSLNTQDVNLLSQTGGLQRADAQARLDAGYQADLQKAYEPYQRTSFVSDILRGTPSGGQTLSVAAAPLPNPFTQALGTGLATAGLFAPKKKG